MTIEPGLITDDSSISFSNMQGYAEARPAECFQFSDGRENLTIGQSDSRNPTIKIAKELDNPRVIEIDKNGRITKVKQEFYFDMDIDRLEGKITLDLKKGTLQGLTKELNETAALYEYNLIMTQKRKLIVPSSRCLTNILLIAPFLQLLFCLHTIEPFIFGGVDDTFLHFSLFLVSCFAAYLLLIVFSRIAKIWQKWVMYIYMAILVLQTGLGLMYVYYEPPLEKFTKEEINSIEAFIKGNEKLPENMQILAWNDSVGIIGKKSIDGVLRYLPNSKKEPKKSKKKDFFTNKYFAPDDFSSYLKLIGNDEVYGYMSGFFWAIQYPNQYIYLYI